MRDERDLRDETDGDGDPLIGSVARELRQPVRLDPALDARVMAEILGAPPTHVAAHPVRRGAGLRPWRWLVEPRTVRISPLFGLAMAAGVAAIMVVAMRRDAGTTGQRDGTVAIQPPSEVQLASRTNDSSRQFTHFVFVAPTAKRVSLVGDFNDWKIDSIALSPVQNQLGVWSVSVPLPPGRYTYTFVVDGNTWVADPSAPPALEDDFGTPKSVVTVGGSHT